MWEIEVKRWWRKTWSPFTLVLVGAVILWLLGYDGSDSGAIPLMTCLIVGAGGYLTYLETRALPPPKNKGGTAFH
jgi:hypothetical protein